MGLFGMDTQGVKDWLSDLGDIVQGGYGIYDRFRNRDDTSPTPIQQPVTPGYPYNPNITPGQLAFTPNWYLVGFGAVLLAVAIFAGRK